MNKKEKTLEKIKILLLIVIVILLLLNFMQKNGIIDNIQNTSRKLLNNGETILEDGGVAKTVNASNWDTNKVTVTRDADGKEVPVPKGYVGSNVAGENKINEGYVIY